ncbi:MAG TPA: FtsW/RodA/SpoVE family cell cycle protein, partial [Dokdonella sp.]
MLLANLHADPQAQRFADVRGRYDGGVILAAVLLACLGAVMVASSSIAVADNQHIGAFYYFKRHLVFLALGLGLALAMARIELDWIERHAPLLLLGGIVLLLLVFVPLVGVRVNGARRWIRFGFFGLQSVEVVKLILIVYMASYLVRHRDNVQASLFGLVKPLAIAALLVALLLAQPDFGSAALLMAVTLGMVWLGGARVRNLLLLGAFAAPLLAGAALSQ